MHLLGQCLQVLQAGFEIGEGAGAFASNGYGDFSPGGYSLAAALLAATAGASGAAGYTVTSGADSGPGTLREALDNGADKITIDPSVATITVMSQLVYAGTQSLKIEGSGVTR